MYLNQLYYNVFDSIVLQYIRIQPNPFNYIRIQFIQFNCNTIKI